MTGYFKVKNYIIVGMEEVMIESSVIHFAKSQELILIRGSDA